MDKIRTALQTRWLFVWCLLILGVAGGVAATTVLVRWQTDRAAGDVKLLLDRDVRQLRLALKSWDNSAELFGDALEKTPRREEGQQAALARSAVEHTPYLVGLGWIDSRRIPQWWVPPSNLSSRERQILAEEIRSRARIRNFFGLPVLQAFSSESDKAFLVVNRPLRRLENQSRRLIALYDLSIFFREALGSAGVRVMDRGLMLYQSPVIGEDFARSAAAPAERSFAYDGVRWTVQRERVIPVAVPAKWLTALFSLSALAFLVALIGLLWAAEQLRQMAMTDPLTGLYNRRFFTQRLEEEVERAQRYQRPVSCLMIDLDGFKQVNDQQGHAAGDRVLRQVAQELRGCLRRADTLARFGGDEFAAVLPETSEEQVSSVVRKLRAISASGAFAPVQLSVGLASLQSGETAHDLIQKADEDLYAGRSVVRNGLRVAV